MRGDGAAMLPQGAAAPQVPHAPAALPPCPRVAAIPQAPVGPLAYLNMDHLRNMLQDGNGLPNFGTVQAMATESKHEITKHIKTIKQATR